MLLYCGGTPPPGFSNDVNNVNGDLLLSGFDFITKAAGNGLYSAVDATKIAAGGHSCGGLETYKVKDDPRVKSLGIFSSGALDATNSTQIVSNITKPIFYFLGGSSDIAYANVSFS